MFLNNVKIFVSRRIDLDSFELNSNVYCQVECGSIYRKKKGWIQSNIKRL